MKIELSAGGHRPPKKQRSYDTLPMGDYLGPRIKASLRGTN